MARAKPDGPRNVLVTGGSRGLGLAIAKQLAGAGYGVTAVARRASKEVTAAIADVGRAGQGTLQFVPFDLGNIEQIPDLVRKLRKDVGPLEELVRVNTLSPLVLTKYVARAMMADGAGRIVNVASIVGFTGYSGLSVYAATKAAMLGFTRSLAREVGRLGITVNAVAPGFLDTEMTHGLAEEQRRKVVGRSALRRLAGVDDVANAVEYLLSESARNISGTVLTIDAGATA